MLGPWDASSIGCQSAFSIECTLVSCIVTFLPTLVWVLWHPGRIEAGSFGFTWINCEPQASWIKEEDEDASMAGLMFVVAVKPPGYGWWRWWWWCRSEDDWLIVMLGSPDATMITTLLMRARPSYPHKNLWKIAIFTYCMSDMVNRQTSKSFWLVYTFSKLISGKYIRSW